MNILFVCTYNQMRSPTAAALYENDKRFRVKSAGVDPSATHTITKEDLEWADYVVTMEKEQANTIRTMYPDMAGQKVILSLFIPDQYYYMQPELVDELKTHFEYVYQARIIPTEMAKEAQEGQE